MVNDPEGLLVYAMDSSGWSNFTFSPGRSVKMYRLARPSPADVAVANVAVDYYFKPEFSWTSFLPFHNSAQGMQA